MVAGIPLESVDDMSLLQKLLLMADSRSYCRQNGGGVSAPHDHRD